MTDNQFAAYATPLSPGSVETLRAFLRANWQTPEAYIVSSFASHDVVLLAEDHAIRHNLLLAQRLIPLLHAAGVYSLGMEFGASDDQAALDALVGVAGVPERYDPAVARQLMFNYNTGWAYRDYMDIYRAAWAFNHSRPAGTRPFRILNLSYQYDWREAGPVQTPESARRVFHQGGTEAYRTGIIEREILQKGEKILVLTGTVHAFTRYAPARYAANEPGFFRFESGNLGQRLHARAPERVFTILLHQPFADKVAGEARLVYPAGGAVDQIMCGFDDQRVGFDLVGTPLGQLPDDSYFATGYDEFRLHQLADGYVYEKAFSQFVGCDVDEQFVTAATWPRARANFPDPHWQPRPVSLDAYWERVRSYVDIKRRYARLTA